MLEGWLAYYLLGQWVQSVASGLFQALLYASVIDMTHLLIEQKLRSSAWALLQLVLKEFAWAWSKLSGLPLEIDELLLTLIKTMAAIHSNKACMDHLPSVTAGNFSFWALQNFNLQQLSSLMVSFSQSILKWFSSVTIVYYQVCIYCCRWLCANFTDLWATKAQHLWFQIISRDRRCHWKGKELEYNSTVEICTTRSVESL